MPTPSLAYIDFGCTADTSSNNAWIIFECHIDIDDPVWYTDVDGIRVTQNANGYYQKCWDSNTNEYHTSGTNQVDDMTYPEWIEGYIVHYIQTTIYASKIWSTPPNILSELV
jgi:hypothetical protein|tara:strand:- start:33 stop:368 length:336 start_codon:yes stop_codon:yes gene_type:complete